MTFAAVVREHIIEARACFEHVSIKRYCNKRTVVPPATDPGNAWRNQKLLVELIRPF